jgi:hypothetical protein
MRLGVTMPRTSVDGSPLTGAALVAGARLVEQVGFDDAILVPPDHTAPTLTALRQLLG